MRHTRATYLLHEHAREHAICASGPQGRRIRRRTLPNGLIQRLQQRSAETASATPARRRVINLLEQRVKVAQ